MKTTHILNSDSHRTLKTDGSSGSLLLKLLTSLAKKNNLPFKIIKDKKTINNPELHIVEGDLFHCLEGEVDFICEGSLVNQINRTNSDGTINNNELIGTKIKNGTSFKLIPGDWLWVPPQTPHQHNSTSSAHLIVIKIPIY